MKAANDHDWAATLLQFTARNAGRLATVEEHDTEIGVQEGEHGIQLRGVSFDPRDGSVAIMLGALHGTQGHLTHVVREVKSIHVLQTSNGRDRALCLVRPNGQTLVRLD
jgi:hypothetical protein